MEATAEARRQTSESATRRRIGGDRVKREVTREEEYQQAQRGRLGANRIQ